MSFILDGNSVHSAQCTCGGKQVFYENNFKFAIAVELTQCLKHVLKEYNHFQIFDFYKLWWYFSMEIIMFLFQ